jgi:hypothetical protein
MPRIYNRLIFLALAAQAARGQSGPAYAGMKQLFNTGAPSVSLWETRK